jgi:hypothetical protein
MLPYVQQGIVIETEVYCYFNYNYYDYKLFVVAEDYCHYPLKHYQEMSIVHMTVTVKAYLNPILLLVTLFIHQNLDTPFRISLF